MLTELSSRNKIFVGIFAVIVSIIVIIITIDTFFGVDTVFNRQGVAALNIGLVLILTLIQTVPVLRDILHNKKVTDEEVTNALTALAQANTSFKSRDYVAAKKTADRVIDILPKKAEAYRIRAQANFELGNYISAIEDYSKAIELEPGYPFTYGSRASAYRTIGEIHKSIDDWKLALKFTPELYGQLFQLGEAYFSIGEYGNAENIFQRVIHHPSTSKNEKNMAADFINRIQRILRPDDLFL